MLFHLLLYASSDLVWKHLEDLEASKILDKLVRQPLTAVRSASVLLAHAGKAEIAVDSRIPLHRPGAVRKIDIGIH